MCATRLLEARTAGTPHHQPADVHSLRAQRHPNTDLIRSPADNIGHKPVDPDGREEYSKQTKKCGELGDEALVGIGARYLFIQRGDVRDRQVAVDLVDGALHRCRDGAEVAGIADFKITEGPRTLRVQEVVDVSRFFPAG